MADILNLKNLYFTTVETRSLLLMCFYDPNLDGNFVYLYPKNSLYSFKEYEEEEQDRKIFNVLCQLKYKEVTQFTYDLYEKLIRIYKENSSQMILSMIEELTEGPYRLIGLEPTSDFHRVRELFVNYLGEKEFSRIFAEFPISLKQQWLHNYNRNLEDVAWESAMFPQDGDRYIFLSEMENMKGYSPVPEEVFDYNRWQYKIHEQL